VIIDFKDKHKGEACLVIGNGPSLEVTPLDQLEKYPAFGANKIYGRGFTPEYWTCVDRDMLHDCIPWMLEHHVLCDKFVPREIPLPGSHQLNIVVESGFSKDASEKVVIGGTVTYVNLQLAWYMGFTTVLLVGVDHKYPKAAAAGKPGSKFIAAGDDPDHFKMADGSPYFAPGRIYNRPELSATERYYAQARQVFEQGGRKIVNLTPGTALDVFEKQSWSKWL
jgi:hypothetical protein